MNRAFKGIWIPKEIWLSEDLTLQEKVFLVEIDSLDNEKGCFASNGYFADFFQLSKSRVSQIINSLEKKELISLNYIYKLNSKEIDKRIIRINEEGFTKILGIKNIKDGIEEIKGGIKYSKDPYLENDNDNNINTNNINNIKTISKDIVTQSKPIIETKSKKGKKAKDIATMRSMINAFTENENIRDKLLEYFNLRLKKGLQPNQWKIILDDLRNFAGDNASIAVDKINGAIAGGYMQIIASWEKDKKNNFNKPKFDNTAGRQVKAVVNMTEDEKKEFEDNLATDEDGNLLQF
jgi:DNA-binding MarR family transcriptional regulator